MPRTKKKRGFFIVFEGGEGSGKSTQLRRLVSWLNKRGKKVIVTKEPGGTEIGEKIREILLNPANKHLSIRSEMFLYQADRAQHIEELVAPELKKGRVVVCDRHADSSAVYQGLCRGLGLDWVQELSRYATQGLRPDLVLVLDIPEDIGISRIRKRLKNDVWLSGRGKKVKLDRIDGEKREFHRKVRAGFLKIAKTRPRHYVVINGKQSQDEVWEAIRSTVAKRLNMEKT